MRRRRLAGELRRLRAEAGMSIDGVAMHVGWTTSKLSRIENRQIGITAADVRKLLDLYGVTDDGLREGLFDMAKRASERGWWQAYGTAIPSEYRNRIGLEAEASEIRAYSTLLIPGLLQTPDYARAVIAVGRPAEASTQIDRHVKVRLSRQEILERDDPPSITAVLCEGVIRRRVGGCAVMAAQLAHLVKMTERPNIVIQVLPFETGEHPMMHGGFEIFDYPQEGDLGMVHVENLTSTLVLEKPDDLRLYSDAFRFVEATALSPTDTRTMLESMQVELSLVKRGGGDEAITCHMAQE